MYVPLAVSALSLLVGTLVLTAPLSLSAQTAPTCTLVANPAVTVPGRGFTLSLISTGATAATINNGIGSIATNGSRPSISIAVTTTYTATVTGAGGSGTCSTTVIVDNTGGYGTDGLGGAAGGAGGGGSGGGGETDPSKILQGLGQMLGGLGQLQNSLGGNNAQNEMCQPSIDPQCPCGQSMREGRCQESGDKWLCTCVNTTNAGRSVGQCIAGQCLGQSTQQQGGGPLGGGAQGLGGGLQALSSILQGLGSLMGGGGGGGSGSGAGAGAGGGYYPPGCTQYYYTATTTSDPCAIYQPSFVSGNLYNNDPSLNVSDSLFDNYPTTASPSPISSYLNGNTGSGSVLEQIASGRSPNEGGMSEEDRLSGDVKNATVLANLRKGFSEIAGFFGGDTLERVCRTRPWAGSSFLAGVAPDTFFDELCKKAGYTESFYNGGGQQVNTSFGSGNTSGFLQGTTTNIATPTAEIRAEPAAVRLGTRTYIFWTSDYVTSCSVTGPSFEQNTLFGAGATVPITGPTSFAINCVAPDGTMVSDSVTVNLAI